jgi:hypothetical protein
MTGNGTTDAAAAAAPFTMLTGADAAMVCEGDVCFVPGFAELSEGEPA